MIWQALHETAPTFSPLEQQSVCRLCPRHSNKNFIFQFSDSVLTT